MLMYKTLPEALANARFISDEQSYRFVKLPAAAITLAAGVIAEIGEPYCSMIVDPHEVTLMIPQTATEDFARRLRDAEIADTVYRVIFIDAALDSSLVGFMAVISGALAEADISIMPYAGYTHDMLFVRAEDHERAMTTLKQLQSAYSSS